MSPAENVVCGKCRNQIPPNAPGGVCPRCMFAAALAGPGVSGQKGRNYAPLATTQFEPHRNRAFCPPAPEELNERFKDLEVESLIGQGGMGAVYRARQTRLDRVVALKILPWTLSSDPTFVERFAREAKTLAKLTHVNIVMVFEFGTVDDMAFLIMEYVDGVNLRDAIRTKSVSPSQALNIVPQICEALQYAHDQGVVHRDIKPENILLNQRGQVKIADFGLAKILGSEAGDFSLTGTNQIMGTRNYMAPEQIEKPQSVDHRADIYSLGVVFYELLTGELPIGRFANPSAKAAVDTQLDEVVLKTLEKEPERRFQHASEVRTAVQEFERQQLGAASQSPAFPIEANHRHPDQTGGLNSHPSLTSHPSPIVSVPFTIPDLSGGFTAAYGVLQLYEQGLALEFEVKEEVFGKVVNAARVVSVPIEKILSAELKKGWFGSQLVVNTGSILVTKDIPASQQGTFKLKLGSEVRSMGVELVQQLNQMLGKRKNNPVVFAAMNPFPGAFTPMPSSSAPQAALATEEGSLAAIKRIKQPANYLKIIGIINLVINSVVFLKTFARLSINPWKNSVFSQWKEWDSALPIAHNIENFTSAFSKILVSPFQFSGGFVSFVVGIMILIAVSNLKSLRNHSLCVALLCVAILPIYNFHFLGCIFAIWALVVILDPKVKSQFQPAESIPNSNPYGGSPVSPRPPVKNGSISMDSRRPWTSRLLPAILLFMGTGLLILILFGMAIFALVLSEDRIRQMPNQKNNDFQIGQPIEESASHSPHSSVSDFNGKSSAQND
jgi:serine/threonine protein kinase